MFTECHPLGVYSRGGAPRRIGVRDGAEIVDLVEGASLNPLMAAGPDAWRELRDRIAGLAGPRYPVDEVELHLPFEVADYVDFYASEHHAARLGRMFRPGQDPLPPAWRDQPLGYHGRSGTVVVSGTPVRRPSGRRRNAEGRVEVGPTRQLDVEVELGFVVGAPSVLGTTVCEADLEKHVFGVVLVNDWSARDIQRFETVPLGPFLGKSFQTSVSPWVVPLSQVEVSGIELELRVNNELLSRPPYRSMYWSPAQMLAHLTSNGASLRTGDLFASGTVSGPDDDQVGSLIELPGQPFLDDGDEAVISATAPDGRGGVIDLGEVRGRVQSG